MIDYQLKKCCNDCLFLDLDYDQHKAYIDCLNPLMIETVIFCKHAKVCNQYNKQTSGRYKWEDD